VPARAPTTTTDPDPAMNQFQDLHVVVTGATGELGGAVAGMLLSRGAQLHLPVRSASRLPQDLARAHVVPDVDLADETAVSAFYRDLPGLWASIHCAGAFAFTPIAEATLADLDKMLAVNARSAFLCSREAARRMRAAGRGGRIVNVAARQALEPRRGAGVVPYAMSKAAVVALTVALAEELASDAIGVNAVAPSTIDTPANRKAMPQADPSKWVQLPDLAQVVAFLASRENTASGSVASVYGTA